MAKLAATDKSLLKFLGSMEVVPEVPEVQILDASIGASGISVEYSQTNQAIDKKFKNAFADYMKENFNGLYAIAGKPPPGVKTISTRVILKSGGGKIKQGVIPTPIQEEGSTIIFNRVLESNKRFPNEESILADPETKNRLEVCFKQKGNWVSRLEDWTWTYYQQQEEFFRKYQDANWSPFVYKDDNFVDWFRTLIKEIKDNGVSVGKYETWNPSDVWAAYRMQDVKADLDEALGENKTLAELNSTLIEMFKKKRLVGISLKKVLYGKDANLKLVNIDTSTMKFGDVSSYGMPEIKLQIGAIFEGETVTTYVKFGNDNAYSININSPKKDRGSNLTFNTHIKKTPAAQGGQAPVAEVQKLLKAKGSKASFINEWQKFPVECDNKQKTGFWDKSDEWEKKYNIVSSFYKGPTPKYEVWKKFITKFYADGKPFIAVSKLMHLSFFYDAIDNFGRNPEFWTDLLYAGMKVGKRYAPHAKIS